MVSCNDVRFFAPLAAKAGTCISLGEQVAIAQHQVLAQAPDNEWSTDDDSFGVLLLDARAGSIALRELRIPRSFPMQPTGANRAKRVFDLEVFASGTLVCSLVTPFSDARGWGKDIFLFRLDPRTEHWDRIVLNRDGKVECQELGDRSEPVELRFGGGEPRFSREPAGQVLVALDVTPYHLEDATRAVTSAVDLGLVAEPTHPRYASGFRLDWRLYAADAPSLELVGFDAYLRARPELGSVVVEKTFALGGGELHSQGERNLVILARAFIERAPFRDFVIVVPAPTSD